MDIKQELKDMARRAMLGSAPGDEVAAMLGAALAEIERLEAGPCHTTCVYEPVQGYPHESGCIGCRIEKHCYKCGHFVDVLSKHR